MPDNPPRVGQQSTQFLLIDGEVIMRLYTLDGVTTDYLMRKTQVAPLIHQLAGILPSIADRWGL